MTFAEALEAALDGKRITRTGWNGAGQWVCYMQSVTIPEALVNGRTKEFVPSGDLNVGGYVIMNAQGTWQPGWLASQGDLAARDWEVLNAVVA